MTTHGQRNTPPGDEQPPTGDIKTRTNGVPAPDPCGPWQNDDELQTWATAIATSLEHWQADRLRCEGPTCNWSPPVPDEEEERWMRAARDALAKLKPPAVDEAAE